MRNIKYFADFITENNNSIPSEFMGENGNKAVDENGTPIKLYRAGNIDTPIKNDKYTVGRFFTTSEQAASAFGQTINTAFVLMKNPFVIDVAGSYYSDIDIPEIMREDFYELMDTIDTDNIAEWAYENGYDGAIIKNVQEGGSVSMKRDKYGYGVVPEVTDDYIVFDVKQIHKL